MSKQSTLDILNQAADKYGLSARERAAFIATARHESGLDPSAVGDNGTSFGLFQMHVGGAGGSTLASAKRYLDPVLSADNRARQFKRMSIVDGAGAARLQRPANPSAYAQSVNKLMGSTPVAQTPVGAGGVMQSPLPSMRTVLPVSTQGSGRGVKISQSIFDLESTLRDISGAAKSASEDDSGAEAVVGGFTHNNSSPVYKQIQKQASLFGLLNDAGDSQTIGGDHERDSNHYRGRAVDFGDAKNSSARLKAFANAARQHPQDFKELYYNPLGWGIKNGKIIKGLAVPGHDDHLHVAE